MKVAIVNGDYPVFTAHLYQLNPGLESRPYHEQIEAVCATGFGLADFLPRNLERLGHQGVQIIANNKHAQAAWLRESQVPGWKRRMWSLRPGDWWPNVLRAQLEEFEPDVVLNQVPGYIGSDVFTQVRSKIGFLVAQVGSELKPHVPSDGYDLFLTSMSNWVRHLRALGHKAELWRLAFEPTVLDHLSDSVEVESVCFVGSFVKAHDDRIRVLETLASAVPLRVYGPDISNLPASSPLRRCWKGPAWGWAMYQALTDSAVVFNGHADWGVPGRPANNLRLFEATGVGSCLVTDTRDDLGELFDVGREVAVYSSADECVDLCRHYLSNQRDRQTMAEAGQIRTLAEHTWLARVAEFVNLVEGLR